jgi:Putative peptidoglycan binding domain
MALTWPLEQEGSTGEDVKTVQYLVTAQGHSTGVDGVFGPLTKAAVEGFQSSRGLGADGIVGQQTWNHLVNGYLSAPDPQTAAKDVFNAWEADNRNQAGTNATPAAVNEIFAQSFSSGDGWSFEGCQGALGHTFCSWKRSNSHELRIGVINAVEGPFYAADQAQFT